MTKEEKFINETIQHTKQVADIMLEISLKLERRGNLHDMSKFLDPERNMFIKYGADLKKITYNSKEYKQCLENLKPALVHHYKANNHHPEFYENGIKGMNLVDIVEMFCDWYAATKKHDDGDIYKSIEINKERFNMSDDLVQIFKNTVKIIQ